MNKEQLTSDKISYLEGLTRRIKCTEEDAQLVSSPLSESIQSGDNYSRGPLEQYGNIINRHGIGDLLETFRLLLYARLQKTAEELKYELLDQINEK